MNFPTWIAVISSIVGFALAHRCLRAKSFKFRMLALVALGVLAIPTILFAVYYLHVLPERVWFYNLRSWPGSEMSAIFLGGAGGALATLLPRFLLVIPLFLTISTTAVPYLKMIFSPLDTGELHEKWDDDACLQSTASTCGPASTASILRFLGYPATEREIAMAAHSSSSGTEAWYLARYLRSRGLTAKFEFGSTIQSLGFTAGGCRSARERIRAFHRGSENRGWPRHLCRSVEWQAGVGTFGIHEDLHLHAISSGDFQAAFVTLDRMRDCRPCGNPVVSRHEIQLFTVRLPGRRPDRNAPCRAAGDGGGGRADENIR